MTVGEGVEKGFTQRHEVRVWRGQAQAAVIGRRAIADAMQPAATTCHGRRRPARAGGRRDKPAALAGEGEQVLVVAFLTGCAPSPSAAVAERHALPFVEIAVGLEWR